MLEDLLFNAKGKRLVMQPDHEVIQRVVEFFGTQFARWCFLGFGWLAFAVGFGLFLFGLFGFDCSGFLYTREFFAPNDAFCPTLQGWCGCGGWSHG